MDILEETLEKISSEKTKQNLIKVEKFLEIKYNSSELVLGNLSLSKTNQIEWKLKLKKREREREKGHFYYLIFDSVHVREFKL